MSKRSTFAVLCVMTAVGGLLVGCDASERGTPTPQSSTGVVTTTSSSPPSTSTLPFAGAPAVANPISAGKFLDNPCLALTSEQLAQLNVGAGKKSQANLGMSCDWVNLDTEGSVNIQFLARFREGLSAIYRANDEHKYAKFEPIDDLAGFPAVVAEVPNQPSDMCAVYVGLSDDLAVAIIVAESREKRGKVDPCDVTKAVAPLALQTMKAGA